MSCVVVCVMRSSGSSAECECSSTFRGTLPSPREYENWRVIELVERELRAVVVDADAEDRRIDLEPLDEIETQPPGEEVAVVLLHGPVGVSRQMTIELDERVVDDDPVGR